EIRLQERQEHREDPLFRADAAHGLEQGGGQRVRLLFQRQPERRPPALVAGHGAPHRRGRPVRQEAQDPAVQRLRGAGGSAVRGHGPEEELLMTLARALLHPAAKPLVFVLSLLPFAWLLWGAIMGGLGANPAEYLIRSTGDWTLRFLCLTLAVTPLRVAAGLPPLARFRRMLGLFMYFYVVLHFLCYGWLDQGLDLAEIAKDIAKRPF